MAQEPISGAYRASISMLNPTTSSTR